MNGFKYSTYHVYLRSSTTISTNAAPSLKTIKSDPAAAAAASHAADNEEKAEKMYLTHHTTTPQFVEKRIPLFIQNFDEREKSRTLKSASTLHVECAGQKSLKSCKIGEEVRRQSAGREPAGRKEGVERSTLRAFGGAPAPK